MPATLLVQARWALVPKNLLLEYTPPFAWQVAEEHRPAVERQADERHR